jgi:virginiamycin B lyase
VHDVGLAPAPQEVAMPTLDLRAALGVLGAGALSLALPATTRAQSGRMQSWPLGTPRPTGIHDVAPAPDGGVWFTAQRSGHLGYFDPKTGKTELIALGARSSPHGVIQGPDRAAWITDGGAQAMVRVGWPDRAVRSFPLPEGTPYANLNTCAFDGDLWFTGQSGAVGKVAVKTGVVTVKESPRGRGPYGICTTPAGEVWWCSLAGSYIAVIRTA